MQLVKLDDLEPGDVLAKDIYTSEGVTLLNEGTEITARYINKLHQLGVNRVYIEDEVGESKKRQIEIVPERVKQEAVVVARGCMQRIDNSENDFNLTEKSQIVKLVKNVVNQICNDEGLIYNLRDIRILEDELFFHLSNVLVLSLVVGKRMGYDKERLMILGMGAFLHDIGKARVPSRILNKPGKLTEQEYEEVKKHTIYGYEILQEMKDIPERVARIAYEHHERCDGSGYPKGITKRFISEYSRIVAIVDVFDSMINERVYRDAIHVREVIEYLYTRFTQNKMDRRIIREFLEVVTPYPVGTKVKLSNGEEAVVSEVNKNNKLRPVVKVLADNSFELDLSENLNIEIREVLS